MNVCNRSKFVSLEMIKCMSPYFQKLENLRRVINVGHFQKALGGYTWLKILPSLKYFFNLQCIFPHFQ